MTVRHGGRDRGSVLRRIFGDGQNPLEWAVTLYTAWGIRVRVHIVFIIYIAAQLIISSAGREAVGAAYMLAAMTVLFGLVLLHEYGHCLVCRRAGGEATDILMWPLGGLATCVPPDHWKAHFWTTAGGPLVHVLLFPVFAGGVLLATSNWGAVFFNPFEYSLVLISEVRTPGGSQPYWLTVLWSAHFMNIVLFAFNVLVPMYPMDGGRLLHALLWRNMSHARAMEITVTVGLVSAIVLVVFGLVTRHTLLFAIGLLGGFACWLERMRLRFFGDSGYEPWRAPTEPRDDPRQERDVVREAARRAEVDRILEKISKHGLHSLTRKEKATLRQASKDPTNP